MSPEETLNTATLSPQAPAPVDAEAVVSSYADSLMVSLFEEVDRLLDGDEVALAALATRGQSGLAVGSEAVAIAAETEVDSATASAQSALVTTTAASLEQLAADETAATSPAEAANRSKTPLGQFLDRFLLVSTALSLLGLFGLIWFGERQPPSQVSGSSVSPSTVGSSQSDQEFLNYLQRSLTVIGKKVEQGPEDTSLGDGTTISLVPVNPPLLPSVGAGSGALEGQRLNVIERVYIPYQTTAPGPSLPSQATAGLPIPQPVVPSPAAAAVPTQPPLPAMVHVLVGVLELGDRSAALFDINGVPQRVYIGERIGTAGWSLVSVSSQEVVIRRNGDVRSIFIGQQF